MEWKDDGCQVTGMHDDFNYKECLYYLNRNQNEITHIVDIHEETITKAIMINQTTVIFQLQKADDQLVITFPTGIPAKELRKATADFVGEWLDLDRNLEPFYRMAAADPVLHRIVPLYKGLRMVGVKDLFEALCWAVMGQQVSLHVAYLLKKRFVESFGSTLSFEHQKLGLFPTASDVANLCVNDLLSLKLSRRKAEYILGIAEWMNAGKLSKEQLQQDPDLIEMEKHLTSIRGVGQWSAHYILMRCIRHPDAFPIADVGLHNALKRVLHLQEKPSIHEIQEWSANWTNWKAYATFYLWRTLLE